MKKYKSLSIIFLALTGLFVTNCGTAQQNDKKKPETPATTATTLKSGDIIFHTSNS